jgi:hypothetical protein
VRAASHRRCRKVYDQSILFLKIPRPIKRGGSQTKKVKYADIYGSLKNSASDTIGEQARSSLRSRHSVAVASE